MIWTCRICKLCNLRDAQIIEDVQTSRKNYKGNYKKYLEFNEFDRNIVFQVFWSTSQFVWSTYIKTLTCILYTPWTCDECIQLPSTPRNQGSFITLIIISLRILHVQPNQSNCLTFQIYRQAKLWLWSSLKSKKDMLGKYLVFATFATKDSNFCMTF